MMAEICLRLLAVAEMPSSAAKKEKRGCEGSGMGREPRVGVKERIIGPSRAFLNGVAYGVERGTV